MLAPEPQMILDVVCTKVGNEISALFVGWSIGQHEAVVSTLAEWLGMTTSQIEEAVAELIDCGLLTNKSQISEWYSGQEKEHLAITHRGWQQWSGFEQMYLDDWNLDSMHEWLASNRVPQDDHHFEETFAMKPKAKAKLDYRKLPKPRSIIDPWSRSME